MNKSPIAALAAALALLGTASAQVTMTPLSSFGANGWLAPGANPYLSTGNTERGFAYNPVTGNLIVVARQNVNGVSNNPAVIDGASGAVVGVLDNTGMSGGTFIANMADCDVTGAIYVCNLSTSASSPFKVYKWNDETLGVPPTVAYDALSGVSRTGDSFAVTFGPQGAVFAGAGTNNVSASNFVVGALDGSNTSTAFLSVPGTGTASNDYRLSLTFVDEDTLIGNQGGLARVTDFDRATGAATVTASIGLGGAAQRAMDYAVVGNTPMLAVIDSNSSNVSIFNVADPAAPVLLATANATTGTLSGNGNGTGSVQWGAISGGTATLYAMNSNQGIQAFVVSVSPLAAATPYGAGCDGLALSSNGLPSLGSADFELVVSGATAAPFAFVGFGTQVVNPGLSLAGVGMAGCDGYTNLDLGLVSTGAVTGGVGVLAFPIPTTTALGGQTFSTQGVAFSFATALGLAVSNGVQIDLGF